MNQKNRFSRILTTANNLVKDSRYQDVLDLLNDVDESKLKPEEKGRFYLTKGEALLFMDEFNHDNPSKAVAVFQFTDYHDEYALAKYLLGWKETLSGQYNKARSSFTESYATYKRINNYGGQARALNRLAFLYNSQCNYQMSLKCLDENILINEQMNRFDHSRQSKVNKAIVYYTQGYFNKSEKILLEQRKSFKTTRERSQKTQTISLAYVEAHLGKVLSALERLDEIKPNMHKFKREYIIYLQYYGWFYYLNQDYPNARKYLNEALSLTTHLSSDSSVISEIKYYLAEVCFNEQKYKEAAQYNSDSLEACRKNSDIKHVGTCLRISGKLEVENGNENKARDDFSEAMAMLSKADSNYELALTRLTAAASNLYDKTDKLAMLYLAKEYFKSENLEHLIKLVDRELNQFNKIVPSFNNFTTIGNSSPQIITNNKKMKEQLNFARKVAPSKYNILLTGETGTGKDLLARYIHYHSEFEGKFISINTAAIPNEMVEAELFGYSKGAYTGAIKDRAGLFEEANSGTLYLNEIADASPQLQAKLLEVLETREVRRLGENKTRKVTFRLIAASNHDVKKRILDNLFRADLYYRLNEIPIEIIPVKDRIDDIPLLTKHFLKSSGYTFNGNYKKEEKLYDILCRQYWEGNVRELKAEINNLCVSSELDIDVMIKLASERTSRKEKGTLFKLLEEYQWNRRAVARELGISEATIRRKIKKFNLSEPSKI